MLRDGHRLFGTDGVRGVANTALTPEFALGLGRAAGELLDIGPVVVGRDTRRSGEMLSSAMQAGFHAVGIDTVDVGVLPSPAIAHATAHSAAMMGVVISASHNPAPDNGIKLLGGDAYKLTDAAEDRIESRLRQGQPWRTPVGPQVGTRFVSQEAGEEYVQSIVRAAQHSFRGIEFVLDTANGAAFKTAPEIFRRLKASIEVIAADPDGTNINEGVGATHPEALARVANGRVGFCFDGDADRLIAIDEDGVPANGDVVMAIIARHLKERDELKNNLVVTTVMANLGFHKAMQALNIDVETAAVGDRYVLESMKRLGADFGGEQSGHMIFLGTATTGDGTLSAVKLADVMASTGKQLRELRKEVITEFPQVLRNVRVGDVSGLAGAELLWAAVADVERELGNDGRVLIRASGTEPVIRVMVEAFEKSVALAKTDELVGVVRSAFA
jgi:phosphoglucosamine mutase